MILKSALIEFSKIKIIYLVNYEISLKFYFTSEKAYLEWENKNNF